jgi:hypothetical protein
MSSMHRRDFIKTTGLTALSLPSALSGQSPRGDLPNIIFIMADDMGYGDGPQPGGPGQL